MFITNVFLLKTYWTVMFLLLTPKYWSHDNQESLATQNEAELEVQAAGVFLANVTQSTPVKPKDCGPGTTRQLTDAHSRLCLLLTSPETEQKRTKPSTSGAYYAFPSIHSHQSVSTNISEHLDKWNYEPVMLFVLSIRKWNNKCCI